ncbi:hypothetical protein THRCLA_11547 [Thraustotheca clavata]|uniref:Uncharacterized protein n=1 Tax=Thraustotheca clavata TaxID=74557 RepID=A0A1V9Y7E3_9STRA|nr:hypothetical protein THRCLA_11547 [Thraustotheca clavata]
MQHNQSTPEEEDRARAIVQTLAAVLESMVQSADTIPPGYMRRTKFEAFRAPQISILDYLLRIQTYAACSPECFVLALIYIDRLHQMQGFVMTDLNVHRVIITSVVLAAKFFDDQYFNNAYYAKVGGVPGSEMNELEVEFLLLTNFSLHVTSETYSRYYNELANHYIFSRTQGDELKHYVKPDRNGQLVYVTDVVRSYDDHEMTAYDSHFTTTSSNPTGLPPSYHHPPNGSTNSYGIASSTNCKKRTRTTSGSKRRNVFPLGVNA